MPAHINRKRQILPMLQGDLDGLCGPYSVINGLRALCPEVDYAMSERLFARSMLLIAARAERSLRVAVDGLGSTMLVAIADDLVRFLGRTGMIELRMKQRRLTSGSGTLRERWHALSQLANSRSVVIMPLRGCCDHWTVLFKVDETHLHLIDSSFREKITRERCTTRLSPTRYHLPRAGLIVLTRER